MRLCQELREHPRLSYQVLGFVDAHYKSAGQTREWLEQAGHDRMVARLQAALPPDRLQSLRDEGAAWAPESADAAALRGATLERAVA